MTVTINEFFTNEYDAKYIQNCWKQFTTLTEQEEENLKKIIKFNKLSKKRKGKKIILWITIK